MPTEEDKGMPSAPPPGSEPGPVTTPFNTPDLKGLVSATDAGASPFPPAAPASEDFVEPPKEIVEEGVAKSGFMMAAGDKQLTVEDLERMFPSKAEAQMTMEGTPVPTATPADTTMPEGSLLGGVVGEAAPVEDAPLTAMQIKTAQEMEYGRMLVERAAGGTAARRRLAAEAAAKRLETRAPADHEDLSIPKDAGQ